jgi:serine/threonine protein kinase
MSAAEHGQDPLLGQIVEERYRLIERLGSGGMGTVYRAERVNIGRAVAVKFLHPSLGSRPDFVQRFQREAMAMSKLYHVHCAALSDFGVHQRSPYLVMEYIPGRTLAADLRSGPVPLHRAVVILQQVLEALRYLHRRNIVHRDLKAQNVMLVSSSSGHDFVKLLDFGMAKMLAGERRDITVQGTIVGTPSVMSPEQIRQTAVDGRTDIYAAGIMLYEMVVGHKPFQHPQMDVLLKMQLEQAPTPPRQLVPGLAPAIETVILRALAKDPAARFRTAPEMSQALASAWAGAAGEVMPRVPRRRRRGWRLAPLLLAAVVLMLAVLAVNR